jgi:tyrosinase
MGGDGIESDQWRVATGQFAHQNGKWPVPDYPEEEGFPDGPGLKRSFGRTGNPPISTLPTRADLLLALREGFYDTPPYNPSPFTIGFRNRIEGFITQRGDSRVTTIGSELHNRVHVWVGGNMLLMTSPDDPVFFLHHCFIDMRWTPSVGQEEG